MSWETAQFQAICLDQQLLASISYCSSLQDAIVVMCRVDPEERRPQAICMCPTRELVVQNLEVVRKMGRYTGIEAVGVNELRVERFMPPITAQIVIGTAGKITNLISRRKLVLDSMRVLVFDEADEMMKVDGFKDTSVGMIQNVRKASEGVQILLFSATFGDSVKNYVTKVPSEYLILTSC
jgi:ATP-dependent RNA helicase DDX19/DBP5